MLSSPLAERGDRAGSDARGHFVSKRSHPKRSNLYIAFSLSLEKCVKLTLRCYLEPIDLSHKIVDYLEDKLAEDILLLDLRGVSDFTDYFVLASGTATVCLPALLMQSPKDTRTRRAKPYIEGNPDWLMVLDYGSVVVHLLSPQMRDYYQLEELWRRGKIVLHLQ